MSLTSLGSKDPTPEKVLRKLFMTVFLRGQSARGLTRSTVPTSIFRKLAFTLISYAAMGALAFFAAGQTVFALSITLHGMTFLMLGMFVASAAGEALFNREEAEILMHRPVTSKMLLRAKAYVLVEISLYLAFAMNAFGFFIGIMEPDGSLLFPIAHVISTVEEALFGTGVVVLVYQLCLRWFGRERLEGAMTTLQVLLVVSITAGSQILPRLAFRNGFSVDLNNVWLKFLPPTWFAAFDDAFAGSGHASSWLMALIGLAATGLILWLAFGKLASVYESGWQTLNESARPKQNQGSRFRLIKTLSEVPPLSWFLRTSISRTSFQLVSAYMFRDRDTKLRLYPGIAPLMIMPLTLFVTGGGFHHTRGGVVNTGWISGFSVSMASAYLCLVPVTALNLLKYSQHWRAAEVFISAPTGGPAPLLQGARVAVLFFLVLPLTLALSVFALATLGLSAMGMILTGVIAMPVYSMIPGALGDNAVPLANPVEESKRASGCLLIGLQMGAALVLAGISSVASSKGYLLYFLLGETCLTFGLCLFLNRLQTRTTWRSYD